MADKRISQLVERVTLATNDVFPIVASGATTTNKVTLQTIDDYMQTNLDFGVTSVAISVPTGLSVTGTPVTSTGTFVITFTAGYSIPTTAKQTQWDTAYTNRITSATAPLAISSNVISITQSGASSDGYLSSTDWNTFNNKQSTITTGNLTEATSSVLTITGGTGAVLGSGTSIEVKQASGSQDGFLDSADWTTFNGKQNALSGTGIVKSTGGTISYLTDNTSNWDSAYNDKINSAAVTGTTTKTLTLTQQDGGTIVATWTDDNTDAVSSVFGRTGAVIAVSGDYNTSQVTENTNLYYTDARARASISLTTTGTTGVSTYNSSTGVINIPNYTPDLSGFVPYTGATGNVDLGTHTLTAKNLVINHASGSGVAASITKGGSGEALTVVKTSGSGNAASITGGVTLISELHLTTDLADTYIASATNWNAAYNDKINSAAVSGTTTKTLTLTQQDGGTITASWTDINTDAVSSVFGRTGAVVATSGDYNTDQVTEGLSSLYFTNARSRSSITLTTTGTSGAATYNSTTGVLNIPSYVGGVTSVNTLTGAVILTTSNIAEGTNLYYTDTRARAAISLTTTGTSGVATYSGGTINIPNYTYTLPTASTSVLGGVKVDGTTITINGSGVISGANTYTLPVATASVLGGVKIGTGVNVDVNGVISVSTNYQAPITLTTTGSSGAATLVGNTLNIPNYSFTETDTLQSVILRNGTTNTGFVITNGNSTYTVPSNTNVPVIYMLNTGANANAHAVVSLRTLGETGGDPFISLDINGVLGWSVGVDNSDGDKFKIGKSWAEVGTNTYFTIDTSGNSVFAGSVRAAGLLSKDYLILEASNSTNNWYLYTYTDNTLRFNYGGAGGDEFVMTTGGGATITGNFTAANFSGSSSGTNTGDQDLSGYVTLGTAQTISGAKTFSNDVLVLGGRVNISTGGTNTYGVVSGYAINNNHQMTMRANITGPTANPTYTAGHQMCFVEYAEANDSTGWFFKTSFTTNYSEVARITRNGIFWDGNTVLHSGNYNGYAPTKTGGGASGTWAITSADSNALGGVGPGGYARRNYSGFSFPTGSYTGWYRIARSGQANGGAGARGAFKIYVCATGNYLNPAQDEICGFKDWTTTLIISSVTSYGATPFQNYRLTYDADFTYLEGYISYYFGGDQSFDVVSMDNGFNGMTWVPMTSLTASTTSTGAYSIGKQSNGTTFPYIVSNTGGLFRGITEFTGNAGDEVGLVRINNTQNAGGIHFPALQVINTNGNHSYGVVAEFRVSNADTGDRPSIMFSRASGPNWQIGMGAYSGGSDRFGIAYRASYLTDAWGSMRMDMDTSGNVTFAGDVTAFSDARLKTDVQVIDNAIEKVKQIRGVTFKRNDEIDHNVGRKHTGVIAQEVLNVLPEVVSMSDTGMYNVAYGNMVGLLVEAIKEQQKEIDELKKQVA
jgi:hypothetical protein